MLTRTTPSRSAEGARPSFNRRFSPDLDYRSQHSPVPVQPNAHPRNVPFAPNTAHDTGLSLDMCSLMCYTACDSAYESRTGSFDLTLCLERAFIHSALAICHFPFSYSSLLNLLIQAA